MCCVAVFTTLGVLPVPAATDRPRPNPHLENEVITFSTIGDVPYGTAEITVFQQHMDDHNLYSASDFLVHVGDILAGSESCDESRYVTVAGILQTLAVPAFIVPGDNETTDCSDPEEGWSFWVEHLMGIEQSFCGVPNVDHQAGRPENFAFILKGVLFIGIHLVGGSNDSQIMQDDADWVDQQLVTHVSNVRAAVVFSQAGPGGNRSQFFDSFEGSADTFGKPLLFIHGDGHSWIQDNPFSPSNVTRVQVDRGDEPPVAVTVDLSGQFSFERDPWPDGTPLLNRAPCVDAGPDTSLAAPGSADLAGMATDDGVPNDPVNLNLTWAQVAGPPGAGIADPTSASTTATLPTGGTYLFELTANDGGLSSSDTMQVFVAGGPVNQPPVTSADSFVTTLNTPLNVPAPGVLGNDFDPDGDPMTAVLETPASNGTLNLLADGSFTYSPDLDFSGNDSFTYRADDGSAPSTPTVVTLTVVSNVLTLNPTDDAHVNAKRSGANFGDNTELRVEQDSSPDICFLKFDLSGAGNAVISAVLRLRVTNASDDGGSVHPVSNDYDGTSTAWDENGLVWDNAPQIVNPVLDSAGSVGVGDWVEFDVSGAIPADGIYSFVIQSNSGNSVRYSSKEGDDPPELVVQAQPPNTPPIAVADSFNVDEDAILTVAAPGVLANDSDVNGDSLAALADAPPANGSLVLSSSGGFTYTPAPNFAGVDSFTYLLADGQGGEDVAVVRLTVNPVSDDPVALDDSYGTGEDSTLVIAAPGVLANDTDADGDSLLATLVTNAPIGTLTLLGDGGFTYIPPPDFTGQTSFTYCAHDAAAADTALVVISIASVNDPPTASPDTFVVARGSRLVVGAPGLLFNDSDVDGDTLQAVLGTGVGNGTLQLDALGGFTYEPPAAFHGTDSFTYVANDGVVGSGEVGVIVRVVERGVTMRSARSAGASNASAVSTSAPLLPVVDQLYVAAVACRPPRAVQSVQGLGLTWTRRSSQCSGRSTADVEVWTALGTPTFGNVTVAFDQVPDRTALHVSRWAAVNPNDPVRVLVSGNANGADGSCSGGVDTDSYGFSLPTGFSGGVSVGFVEAGMQPHQPASGFAIVNSVLHGDSTSVASLHVASRNAATTPTTWSGSFGQAVDWSAVALEVRPAAVGEPGRPRAAVLTALPSNPVVGGAAVLYRLQVPTHVAVRVYDVRGKLVRQIVNAMQSPGPQRIVWDTHTESGRRASAGVYFMKLQLGSSTHVRKLILVR